ncbi:MAG TPA: nitrite reductase large subunit NirB [Acidimicrobiales bacterium]|nr:nitrite reductase large subunit NirB [Acidimicrobiales bacterium]
MTRPLVLVVGHGMVGAKLVELLVRRGTTATTDVVVVGDEPTGGYDRVHLSRLFEGASPDDLSLVDPAVAADPAVTVLAGERVEQLDSAGRVARTSAGRTIRYDTAVLATGSVPFVPPVPGRDLPGCFTYRTVDDVERIRTWSNGRAHGVVVGGGLLGLEAAGALRSCGVAVEVVEVAPHLMAAQVDADGGALLGARIGDLGVAVHTSTTLLGVVAGTDGAVAAVELGPAGGEGHAGRLATEMVVVAAGIRPCDALARDAGIAVGPRGGVVVDDACRTSAPGVLAIGECALAGGRVHGLVAPGYQMARVAAAVIAGEPASLRLGETPTKLKLLGVDVASVGLPSAPVPPGGTEVRFTDGTSRVHRRVVLGANGGVVGAVLVGDTSGFDDLAAMAAGDAEVPDDLAGLRAPAAAGDRDPAAGAGGAAALRDTATICSCENVAKGAICAAVAGAIAATGRADVAAVKAATRAGTGCGGCAPQLAQLVDAGLAAAGVEADTRLCPHFADSRAALHERVRTAGCTTWAEVAARFADPGTGSGCEVCKPTVASILASTDGRYVLDGDLAALQDTNDHLLANLQRDGTYSVVPRVPGGEITAERLIVLGEVAQAFGLYVKITGGQRIDLLGARVDQLPAIWARLVDAGFESGHAYGKAVRTVKSCVGSTWCRYGVQDSTGLAIDLELRYRGLRSPHKVKMGVSGCVRECAEAQGKDVGVIATERGWNLYVGGNGGARPRHADLLAADLDRAGLVRVVDRFLAYYIRTADRLQRTSAWIESLDGGVEHLRRVIVDDELGIGADLEADIDRHVARYRCEWAETLADPARLRRFRTFVNSEEADPSIVVVTERDQPRPAPAWQRVELAGARP